MMKKYFFILFALTAMTFTACKNDKDMVDATVVDTGDLTYEGCGYVLKLTDAALVQPMNLPSAYQHDGMEVKVKYSHTGIQDTCKYGTVIYDLIDIEKIKKVN
jgi:hypothetical protein